jgi:hypothetical protein
MGHLVGFLMDSSSSLAWHLKSMGAALEPGCVVVSLLLGPLTCACSLGLQVEAWSLGP